MAETYIAEIRIFASNFAPRGWAFCDGQLLAISQFEAMFALIGTTYGGDGITTFALPDFRGRIPVGMGTGPGLSPRDLRVNYGGRYGTEWVTLPNNIPSHRHNFSGTTDDAQSTEPSGKVLAKTVNAKYYEEIDNDETILPLNPDSIHSTGGAQPHSNMMPSLCIHYIIALAGTFPSRH